MEQVVWAEKYRPIKLSDIIDQKHVVERLKVFIKEKNIPHMLFAGPAGTGKCVEKETPIALENGEIKPIKNIQKGDYVLSLSENGIITPRKVNDVIKRKDNVLKITTKLGNEVEVTKEHPFLVLKDGLPQWKEASQLQVKDFIATPLSLNANSSINDKIDFTLLNNFWVKLRNKKSIPTFELFEGKIKKLLECFNDQDTWTYRQLTEKLRFKRSTVEWCLKKLMKLGIVKKSHKNFYIHKKYTETRIIPLRLRSTEKIDKISYKGKYKSFSVWIKPFNLSKEFCEWLGYILSEGTIKTSEIIFNNKNPILLKRFGYVTKKVFGINAMKHPDGLCIRKAATIVKLLSECFDVPFGNQKSYRIKLPPVFFKLPKDKLSRFIRAYLDGDGFVNESSIEFYSNSRDMLLGIKIVLLRFSVLSRLSHKLIKGKERYRLTISGSRNVSNFKKYIGSLLWKEKFVIKEDITNKDVMQINRGMVQIILTSLNIHYEDILPEHEIEYVFQRGIASREKIQEIYRRICDISRNKLSKLIEIYSLLQNNKEKFKQIEELDRFTNSLLEDIVSIEIRKYLEKETKIRSDRFLRYYQRKHEPNLNNILKILRALSGLKNNEHYKEVFSNILFMLNFRKKILEVIDMLGISYNDISAIINEPSGNVNYYLNEDGLTVTSLKKILKIIEFIECLIETRIFDEILIGKLEMLEFLSKAEIFWDRVMDVKKTGIKEVVDLSIEGSHNFIGGHGPFILHNTTTALAIAHELYGKEWRANVLELNASDTRGIDTIRGQVKDFARTKSLSNVGYRLIILDESDALTPEAQQALRRTMENYTNVSRFILICNYSSKIIEPIQSRCSVFRFKGLTETGIKKFIERIVEGEKLKISEDGIKAIIEISEGDLRRVANLLQVSSTLKEKITEDIVYDVASRAKPTDVKEMLELALNGKFMDVRKKLQDLILMQGLAGTDIIAEIHKQIYSLDIPEEKKVQLIEKVGEYEFRLSEGSNELIQLEALLAQFLLFSKSK